MNQQKTSGKHCKKQKRQRVRRLLLTVMGVSFLSANVAMVYAVAAFSEMQVAKAEAREAAAAIQVVENSEPVIVQAVVIPEAVPVKAVEPCPTVESEVAVAENATTYPVPLDEDLQLFIIRLCEEHHIDPAVVFCMIHQESSFDASKIGDSGEAFGLMQVWPKWHSDRMKKLGCEDLLDPYQNVTVGIDYYAECLEKYDGDNAKALTAYNQGSYKGVVNKHAKAVLAKLEDLKDVMK